MTDARRRYRLRVALLAAAVAVVIGIGAIANHGSRIDVSTGSLRIEGETRSFRVAAAQSRVPDQGLPLVLAFHGTGGSPAGFARSSKLDALAAKHRFIVVYPEAIRGMWRTVEIATADPDEHPDIRFVDRLLTHMQQRFLIDSDHIYAVGMSNGGTFVEVLAQWRPGRFAAIVPHSAPSAEELNRPETSHLPAMLFIVGTEDMQASTKHVQAASERFARSGYPTELLIIQGIGHEWATRYNEQTWQFLSQHSFGRPTQENHATLRNISPAQSKPQ